MAKGYVAWAPGGFASWSGLVGFSPEARFPFFMTRFFFLFLLFSVLDSNLNLLICFTGFEFINYYEMDGGCL
jgi:hypothetical protein